MADYTVIHDVGSTLIKLFREQMIPDPIMGPEESIIMASPAEVNTNSGNSVRLSLFLYEVKQNPISNPYNMIDNGSNKLSYPPMALDLHYLLTAHSLSDTAFASRTLEEHRIMGRALQVLHDHSVIRNSLLQGSLADHNEELHIQMKEPVPVNLLGVLFPNVSYKLSYNFVVGPIYLDSRRSEHITRVIAPDVETKPLAKPLSGGETQ